MLQSFKFSDILILSEKFSLLKMQYIIFHHHSSQVKSSQLKYIYVKNIKIYIYLYLLFFPLSKSN